MQRQIVRWLLLLSILIAIIPVNAQSDTVEITFPQPVTLLAGSVEIKGTANVPNLVGFFIQVRELNTDLTPVGGEGALWAPATLPLETPVVDGVLGTWNTTLVNDGIYELQLVVNVAGANPLRTTIRPIRVENTAPPYQGRRVAGQEIPQMVVPPTLQATQTNGNLLQPLPIPTATAITRTGVFVTANVQANVRLGDSTSYPAVGFLNAGQTVEAVGQSTRSSWLLVRLPDGEQGYMSPSTLRIEGDTSFLPRVEPPPLPYTPTPVPTATPIASGNLRISSLRLEPSEPACDQTFNIIATIQNNGTGRTRGTGIISVVDRHVSTGNVTEQTIGGVPELDPGQTFNAVIPITVNVYYEERHRVELFVDVNRNIQETDEGDNGYAYEYTLRKGTCGD